MTTNVNGKPSGSHRRGARSTTAGEPGRTRPSAIPKRIVLARMSYGAIS